MGETGLPAIARAFAIQGEFDQALQIADSMTDKVTKADALLAIAQVYTANLAERSAFESWVSSLVDRVRSLVGDSDREKAAEVLEQALQVTQSIAASNAH